MTTWMHLRSKHWHLLDYVIAGQKDKQDITVTKLMRGADCWTGHQLLFSKINIKIHSSDDLKGKKSQNEIKIVKTSLSTAVTKSSSLLLLKSRTDLRNIALAFGMLNRTGLLFLTPVILQATWYWYPQAAITKTGFTRITITSSLCWKKNEAFTDASLLTLYMYRKRPSTTSEDLLSLNYTNARHTELSQKADEIQAYANFNDMKNVYSALKSVYDSTSSGPSPLLSADGSTLITDKDKILERCADHQSLAKKQSKDCHRSR